MKKLKPENWLEPGKIMSLFVQNGTLRLLRERWPEEPARQVDGGPRECPQDGLAAYPNSMHSQLFEDPD